MELNPEVSEILKEFKIDRSEGLLCLLAYHFNLEPERVCSEETIKAVSLTKIVEKDFNSHTLTWNIPLFTGQQTEFDWVRDWMKPFATMNPARASSWRDTTARMKEFFKKYPQYRKDDIYRARDLYLSTVKDPQYLKATHKFIFEGMGGAKTSILLGFCEKLETSNVRVVQRGKIVS